MFFRSERNLNKMDAKMLYGEEEKKKEKMFCCVAEKKM